MSFLDELFSHAKEVYGTLSHNERIKERSRAYRDSVKQGLLSNFPMLAKDPQEVTAADIIGSGFGAMPLAIKAWHGSPHKFDKFDMSKIGTGEGAQVYGHGLYFAENPETAKSYRATTSKGFGLPDGDTIQGLANVIAMRGEDFAKKMYAELGDNLEPMIEKAKAAIDEKSSLYETSLQWPDAAREASDPLGPQHFLDWDNPTNAGSFARESLKGKVLSNGHDITDFDYKKGRDLYSILSMNLGGEKKVAAFLKKQGIPGIRYADQGSRGADGGTYNYVVFDDQIPRIVKRNGSFLGLFPEGY